MTSKSLVIEKLVTGGQTGTDRAALDYALAMQLPYGGWCPRGRLAEDGTIDARYTLQETPTDVYAQRTEWNARDSQGTLILLRGEAGGGTLLTIECAQKYARPYFLHEMNDEPDVRAFKEWLHQHSIRILNVAGPRESLEPGVVYARSLHCIKLFLAPE